MSNDGAREFMTAYMRKGRGQPGHLPSGEDGVGVAVRCGLDADEEIIWMGWCGYGFSRRELVRCVIAVEALGTHLWWEISSCHCFQRMCDLVSVLVLARNENYTSSS